MWHSNSSILEVTTKTKQQEAILKEFSLQWSNSDNLSMLILVEDTQNQDILQGASQTIPHNLNLMWVTTFQEVLVSFTTLTHLQCLCRITVSRMCFSNTAAFQ